MAMQETSMVGDPLSFLMDHNDPFEVAYGNGVPNHWRHIARMGALVAFK